MLTIDIVLEAPQNIIIVELIVVSLLSMTTARV